MKAIVVEHFVSQISDLRVSSDVPVPQPQSGEVLVRISHAGLNYVDLLYARGKHQNNTRLIRPPFVLGMEFSGLVESAPASSSLKQGDRVFGGGVGMFAEYVAVDESRVRKMPDAWSFEGAAALAGTAPVSYMGLVRVADVRKGEWVLVHGAAGGLGVMAVQIAKALGAKVIGTVGSEEKAKVVRDLGADHVIDYRQGDWEKEVIRVADGKGVHVTFDSVGLVEKSIRASRYGARVVIVGFAGRDGVMEKLGVNRVLLKSIKLLGFRYGETGRQYPDESEAVWGGLEELLRAGSVKPVVYRERYHGLDSVLDGLQELERRKVWGKAIVKIQGLDTDKARL